jgi:two-component system, NarL family, sensor histidine kinase LiaS
MKSKFKRHFLHGLSLILRWSEPEGLQAQITTLYVRTTVFVIILLTCLYTGLLTGSIYYILQQQEQSSQTVSSSSFITYPIQAALVILVIAWLISPFIGSVFGSIAAKDVIRRIHRLIQATTIMAKGNYKQRILSTGHDEIGQLEEQFNRMAEQLEVSMTERQQLAAQNARLAERARISRELHDAISQNLFSLRMLADGFHLALPEDSPLQRHIATMEQTTTDTILEMRALLLELRPIHLDQYGLSTALEALAEGYRARLHIEVNVNIVLASLEAKVEHALLRIVQEALSNAVRHADATIISIDLIREGKNIICMIADNGKGFLVKEKETTYGLGLHLMLERAQELQGTCEISSALNQGTMLRISVPAGDEHEVQSAI